MITQRFRLTKADQPSQRALAIRCGSVKEYTGHRLVLAVRVLRVDALANTRGCIATFQGELPHQGMRERMQQYVTNTGIICLRVVDVPRLAPAIVRLVKLYVVLPHREALLPVLNCLLAELQEDTFSAHLG